MADQEMLPGMEEALPLFSGTPMRVTRRAAEPVADASASDVSPGQQSFASCGLCKDTGRLRNDDRLHYCWCAAGDAARAEDREKSTPICEIALSTIREGGLHAAPLG